MRRVVEASQWSRTGRCHATNEDAHRVDLRRRLAVVADGMGGHRAGEVASSLALQTVFVLATANLHDLTLTPAPVRRSIRSCLRKAVLSADEVVRQAQHADPGELGGMGCALVVVHWARKYWHIAHVGDIRVYAYCGGRLQQMTQDHSATSDLVRAGYISTEEAERHPLRHHLTQSVGHGDVRPELLSIPIVLSTPKRRSWLVVCTDGVWDSLGENQMVAALRRSTNERVAARRLVDTAWRADGRDDCTAAVLSMRGRHRVNPCK